ATEGDDAFLNAGAAGVVEAKDGRPHARGHIHNLDDFSGFGFGKRSPENREILRENEYQAAVDAPVAGYEAVAEILALGEAEVVGAMGHQAIGLFERTFIEQKLNALARRHLPFFMLSFAALAASAFLGQLVAALELLQLFFNVHSGNYRTGRTSSASARSGKSDGPHLRFQQASTHEYPASSKTTKIVTNRPPH